MVGEGSSVGIGDGAESALSSGVGVPVGSVVPGTLVLAASCRECVVLLPTDSEPALAAGFWVCVG